MQNNTLKGISWFIMAMFSGALSDVFIRVLLDDGLHSLQLLFLRCAVILILFIPWLLKNGVKKTIVTPNIRHYASLSFFMILSIAIYFEAMDHVPLPQLAALSLAVTPISMILAVVILKEQCGWHKIFALIIGFSGVLLILRPDIAEFNPYFLYPIVSAFTWAMVGILIKQLSVNDSPAKISFYPLLFMTPVSLPFALLYWQEISFIQLMLVLGNGVFIGTFLISWAKAYSLADITTLVPFDFFYLIFMSILAYIFFAEMIDIWTALGGLIIVLSGWYIIKKEKGKHTPQEISVEH